MQPDAGLALVASEDWQGYVPCHDVLAAGVGADVQIRQSPSAHGGRHLAASGLRSSCSQWQAVIEGWVRGLEESLGIAAIEQLNRRSRIVLTAPGVKFEHFVACSLLREAKSDVASRCSGSPGVNDLEISFWGPPSRMVPTIFLVFSMG